MTIKRYAAASSAAVLLALSLTACGDDAGGAPSDASEKEFCEAYNQESDLGEDASAEEEVDEAHQMADKLKEVGTPEGISDDEREGFEILVDAVADINEDDIENFTNAESEDDFKDALGASDEDYDKVNAFLSYAQTTCAETE
jgi:hypothetical protein